MRVAGVVAALFARRQQLGVDVELSPVGRRATAHKPRTVFGTSFVERVVERALGCPHVAVAVLVDFFIGCNVGNREVDVFDGEHNAP